MNIYKLVVYIYLSICQSHLRSAGFADQMSIKKQDRSHVLWTSLILRTGSNALIDVLPTEIHAVMVCYHLFLCNLVIEDMRNTRHETWLCALF